MTVQTAVAPETTHPHALIDDDIEARTESRLRQQQVTEERILEAASRASFGIQEILRIVSETHSSRSDVDYSISRLQQQGKLTFVGTGYVAKVHPASTTQDQH